MNMKTFAIAAAVGSMLALSASPAFAADQAKEKCYGVAKAGNEEGVMHMGQSQIIAPSGQIDRKTLLGGISALSLGAYTDDPILQHAVAHHQQPCGIPRLGGAQRDPVVGQIEVEIGGLHQAAQRP